jgi:hypothetical protein
MNSSTGREELLVLLTDGPEFAEATPGLSPAEARPGAASSSVAPRALGPFAYWLALRAATAENVSWLLGHRANLEKTKGAPAGGALKALGQPAVQEGGRGAQVPPQFLEVGARAWLTPTEIAKLAALVGASPKSPSGPEFPAQVQGQVVAPAPVLCPTDEAAGVAERAGAGCPAPNEQLRKDQTLIIQLLSQRRQSASDPRSLPLAFGGLDRGDVEKLGSPNCSGESQLLLGGQERPSRHPYLNIKNMPEPPTLVPQEPGASFKPIAPVPKRAPPPLPADALPDIPGDMLARPGQLPKGLAKGKAVEPPAAE